MTGRAKFQPDLRGQRGGNADPRTKNTDDQWIPGAHHFHAAADANPEHFQALNFITVAVHPAHHGALPRLEPVQRNLRAMRGIWYHHYHYIVLNRLAFKQANLSLAF